MEPDAEPFVCMAHRMHDVPLLVKPGPQATHADVEASGAKPTAQDNAGEGDTHAFPDAVVPTGHTETHASAPAALYVAGEHS